MENKRKILVNEGFNMLAEGKSIRIRAHGYSMYPCIRPGSVILIEPVWIKGDPVPGEIVAIKRESGLIVHRLKKIVQKNGMDYYIARGDSNAFPDDPVRLHIIAGRVVSGEWKGKPFNLNKNVRQDYFLNRVRVIWILFMKRISRLLHPN